MRRYVLGERKGSRHTGYGTRGTGHGIGRRKAHGQRIAGQYQNTLNSLARAADKSCTGMAQCSEEPMVLCKS